MFLFVDMIKSEFFNRFMGMCIPAIFLGVNCAFNQNEKKCMHYFEYLLVLSIIPFLLVLKDFMQTFKDLKNRNILSESYIDDAILRLSW